MKKLVLSLMGIFISTHVFSQVIGTGYTTNMGENSFNTPLKSGVYASSFPQSKFPGNKSGVSNHLITVRTSTDWNFQMQIASNFDTNDQLYFRKVAVANLGNATNSWHEIATRGDNTFTGNQTVQGTLTVNGTQWNNGNMRIADNKYFYIGGTTNSANRTYIVYNDEYKQTFLDYNPQFIIRRNQTEVMRLTADGKVGIGYWNPKGKLDVNGTIRCKELKVETANWSDFVFDDNYQLPDLQEVKTHINTHKHLPGIPSESEVVENGINVGEMQAKLLLKIEELTLYVIQQQEQIDDLKSKLKN